MAEVLEGLGAIPEGWTVIPFQRVLSGNIRNGVYKPKEFHGRGVKIINMGELFSHPRLGNVPMKRLDMSDGELARFGVSAGDLLFARRSLVAEGAGKCCLVLEVSEPTVFESSLIRATPDPGLANSEWLYYMFSSPFGKYSLGTILRQTAVSGVTGTDLIKLPIPLPPIEEQRRIAAVLGALDDKIELNRKMNRTLEEMAQALFKSWFVDFNGHKDFEDSEIGPIPRGWTPQPLLDIAQLQSGGTPQTSNAEYWNGPIKWASAKDVSNSAHRYLLDTERTITEAGLSKSPTRIIPAGSVVVVARGATCGRWCLLGEDMAMNQTCYALVANDPIVKTYIKHLISGLIARLVQQAHGSVFDTITTRTFASVSVVVPPDDLLQRFHRTVGDLEDRILVNIRESRTLSELRDLLLPKLISGEIRVPESLNLDSPP